MTVFFGNQKIRLVSVSVMLSLYGFFIIYGVYKIRKVIKTINFAIPNERLMNFHFANFIIYSLIFIVRKAMQIKSQPHDKE